MTNQSEYWTTPHIVVFEDQAIKLLKFRDGEGEPILIVPPQAGHDSTIADFAPDQSLVQAALESTTLPVYAIEFKSCTFDRKNEMYTDLIKQVQIAIHETSERKVHLVGLCQGGTLASIYSALNPNDVASLTVAGAPIDVRAGKSVLSKAFNTPLWQYQVMVALGAGLVHGEFMLFNWKSNNLKKHYVDRYMRPSERNDMFYEWYDRPANIAGGWYLWLIENLFLKNRLINDEMELYGKPVLLSNIECPVYLVAGERDDISPPSHTFNMADKVSDVTKFLIPGAGHIGVFMGKDSMSTWAGIFSLMEAGPALAA